MARSLRHIKILELINSYNIETQDELALKLVSMGFKVTQATVSRDIKELGLIKVMSDDKRYKYASVETNDCNVSGKLYNLFKESVVSIKSSLNTIVIRTMAGSANTAAAFVDKLNMDSILGTVAGDDTILIIVNELENVDPLINKLSSYL